MPRARTNINKKNKSFRERRYDKKRDAIIKRAIKAFGEKGFHATTIEEITNALMMTKGSFYYYFSNKEDLLYEAHLSSLKSVTEVIKKIKDSDDPPDVKIKAAIAEHLSVLARDLEGAFLLQHQFLPKEHLQEIIAMRNNYEKFFIKIIEEGARAGLFRIKNTKLAAYIILGTINWFLRWYSSSGSWSLEEIVDTYVDLLCAGLLTDK